VGLAEANRAFRPRAWSVLAIEATMSELAKWGMVSEAFGFLVGEISSRQQYIEQAELTPGPGGTIAYCDPTPGSRLGAVVRIVPSAAGAKEPMCLFVDRDFFPIHSKEEAVGHLPLPRG
jgi:hypothetical protein